MIVSTILAPSNSEHSTGFSKVIYVNSTDNFIAERYCMLRADTVIFLDATGTKNHQSFCKYLSIPYYIAKINTFELDDFRRIAIIGETKSPEKLNAVYGILKNCSTSLEVYTSGKQTAGTCIMSKLIKKEETHEQRKEVIPSDGSTSYRK